MPELRAATPSDAKAVWESFEQAGTKPSIGDVVTALNQSGQFMPMAKSTVHRWKQSGWAAPTREPKRPANVRAKAAVEAAVPAVTGDPTSKPADVVNDPETQEERDRLAKLPIGELANEANREGFITTILLFQRVQRHLNMVETQPREIGTLQQAIAGSLGVANGGLETMMALQDRIMTLIPNAAATEKAPENEPLSAAIAAFSKAENEHG